MRLLIHVEGETEEDFVNQVLAPYLARHGFTSISARLLGNARQRNRRGGARSWKGVRKEILRHLRSDRECIGATLVDFYGLPTGVGAWPGREDAAALPFPDNGRHVESELAKDIESELSDGSGRTRFVPHVVMHEFEGLLFADCGAFSRGIRNLSIEPGLQAIRDAFSSPEEIDDSPESAPSKRILELMPGYRKPLHGVWAACEIGIEKILEECPHFRSWIERLKNLAREA